MRRRRVADHPIATIVAIAIDRISTSCRRAPVVVPFDRRIER
ncbi:hypothetical protein C7S17_6721 [Burkholderia thailandensis]|nr:hypothetical protein [Burkholderia thailandensis]